MTGLLVAVGAFAGAVCRYVVDVAVQHRTDAVLPLGTLTVNLSGSLGLGFLVGLGLHHGIDDNVQTIVGAGFLGAYTTFSTFAYETVRLLQDGSTFEAFANAAAGSVLGPAGCRRRTRPGRRAVTAPAAKT